MTFKLKLGSINVSDGIRKMTKENFENAYGHIFRRTTEDKWALGRFNGVGIYINRNHLAFAEL